MDAFARSCLFALAIASTLPADGADLRVLSGGAAQRPLRALAEKFEVETGNKVDLDFAVVGAIQSRLVAGEKADVLMLPLPMLDELKTSGRFDARSRTVVGRVGIAVVVRAGAKAPDISSADAVRKALLDAGSVVFPDPISTPTGRHMMRMLAEMGIGDAMRPKITFMNAIDGGVDLVRDGRAEMGLFLATEIAPSSAIALIGPLPASLQGFVVYGAAISADTGHPGEAAELVRFISSPGGRALWRAAGFEVPEK